MFLIRYPLFNPGFKVDNMETVSSKSHSTWSTHKRSLIIINISYDKWNERHQNENHQNEYHGGPASY